MFQKQIKLEISHSRLSRLARSAITTALASMLALGLVSPSNAGVTTTYLATDPTALPSGFPFTTTNSYTKATAFSATAQTLGTASIHGFGSQDTTICSGSFENGNVDWSYTGSYLAGFSCVTNTQTGNANDGFNAYGGVNWFGIDTGSLTLTFRSSPTKSFGAFFSGLGAGLMVSFNDGTNKTLTIPAIANGNGLEFWGFTDTSGFSRITITYASACGGVGTPPCDNFGVDGIIFNNSIPEPGTLTLFGLGLAGLAALRRRKH